MTIVPGSTQDTATGPLRPGDVGRVIEPLSLTTLRVSFNGQVGSYDITRLRIVNDADLFPPPGVGDVIPKSGELCQRLWFYVDLMLAQYGGGATQLNQHACRFIRAHRNTETLSIPSALVLSIANHLLRLVQQDGSGGVQVTTCI